MKNFAIIITPLILGIISTAVSYFRYVGSGDFSFNGFPFPYYRGVWGMGMSYQFDFIFFIIDIIVWSVLWFFIIKIISFIRKRIICRNESK